VDPRAGLDDLEKRKFLTLPGLELQPLSRPACSQTLYRLLYLYIHSPIRLHGVVLNLLSTGTTLPLPYLLQLFWFLHSIEVISGWHDLSSD
jgi:hypothetical protein